MGQDHELASQAQAEGSPMIDDDLADLLRHLSSNQVKISAVLTGLFSYSIGDPIQGMSVSQFKTIKGQLDDLLENNTLILRSLEKVFAKRSPPG